MLITFNFGILIITFIMFQTNLQPSISSFLFPYYKHYQLILSKIKLLKQLVNCFLFEILVAKFQLSIEYLQKVLTLFIWVLYATISLVSLFIHWLNFILHFQQVSQTIIPPYLIIFFNWFIWVELLFEYSFQIHLTVFNIFPHNFYTHFVINQLFVYSYVIRCLP